MTTEPRISPWWHRRWIAVFALAAVYVLAARLGLLLALPPEKKATAVWPPSGIALAALLISGLRLWPGVWLGAFLANLWDYFDPANRSSFIAHVGVSAGIALGSTLQTLAGATLLRRFAAGAAILDSTRRVFLFVGIALSVCVIAASFGVTSLCLGGFAPWKAAFTIWWTWWLGDATGMLLVTPLLLAWSGSTPVAEPGRYREAVLLLIVSLAVSGTVFEWGEEVGVTPLAYLTLPVLVWAAVRFGARGATAMLVLVTGLAVWGTATGSGPFLRPTLTDSLLLLQVFMGVVALTTLVLVATLRERGLVTGSLRASEERYRVLTEALPHMVWAMRPDLTLEFLNQPAAEFTGLSVAEVNAGGWGRLIHPDDLPGMLAVVSGPLTRGEPHGAEYRFRHRTGEYRWVVSRTVPLKNAGGAVVQWIGSTHDIHNRKTAEEELRELNATLEQRVAERTRALEESEQRFRAIFHAQFQFIGLMRPDGTLVEANRTALAAAGIHEEAVLDKPFWETPWWTHDPIQQERLRDAVRRAAHGERVRFEASHPTPGGGVMWVDFSLTPFRDAADRVVLLIPEGRDITERKKVEAALAASEVLLRQFVTHAPAAIAMLDNEMRYLRVSDRWLKDYHLDGRDIIGRSHYDVFPDIPDRWKEVHKRVLAGAVEACDEDPFPRADGGMEWLQWEARPWRGPGGKVGGLIFFTQVITARKQIEAAVRESEERFRAFMDHLPLAAWAADAQGRLLMANRFLGGMLSREPDELIGLTRYDLLPAADARAHEANDRRVLEIGGAIELEETYGRPDGARGVTFSVKFPVRGTDGATVVGGVAMDVTARKQAEAALQESEERFRSAFEYAPIGIALVAPDGRWLRVNRLVCEIVGYSEPELLATDFQTITHPDDLESDLGYVREVLAGTIQAYQMEKRYFHKRGHIVHILLSVSLVRGAAGAPLYFVSQIQDISQRKRAEEQVKASLREKELLLKEIHHRVKNNLQIVSTLLDLQSDHTADPQAMEMFQESRGRVKSMALIHERLYRSHDLARVNFVEYVQQLAEDLYRTYKASDDEIRLDVEVDVPPLPIDIAIPCGLLLNELISNCLKHAFKDATEGHIRVALRTDDGTTLLTVADDGAGFPPHVDFRNTTSFGMQLVNTLTEQLNGKIELTTGVGTEITVTFNSPF